MNKFRMYIIEKLAGESQVAINVNVIGSLIIDKNKETLVKDVHVFKGLTQYQEYLYKKEG